MNGTYSDQTPVVKLEHISFSYGKVQALDDFSLEIAPRKLVGLIGPDGVGKSTMLSLVTGARAMQESGSITVLGGEFAHLAHEEGTYNIRGGEYNTADVLNYLSDGTTYTETTRNGKTVYVVHTN